MGDKPTMKAPVFRLYGRQKTRALNDKQCELMEQLLPNLDISIPDLSKKTNPILEIGFGFGEHLAHMAEKDPATFFVGFEPFVNGVASLLQYIDEKDLTNISLHQGDVRHLFPEMPDQLFSAIYLLYPDPWPKKRHFKRRFVQTETLATLHRLLMPKGKLHIASDHDTYQTWIEEHIESEPVAKTFEWANKATKATAWDGWMTTRYEEKAFREGRTPRYYVLTKK
ncbi:MAG: tRNA (guanosine(46)-N7)-methyltransferase TrmB [Pseudomonadota bacterium]